MVLAEPVQNTPGNSNAATEPTCVAVLVTEVVPACNETARDKGDRPPAELNPAIGPEPEAFENKVEPA